MLFVYVQLLSSAPVAGISGKLALRVVCGYLVVTGIGALLAS